MANSFLPEYAKSRLPSDDAKNLEELEEYLERVSVEEEIVQPRVLGRLLRVIQTRLDLKYETSDATRSRVMGVLLDTYKLRRCAIPLKTRLLNVAGRVCKNKRHDIVLPSPFDWEYHWEELISVCTRSKKYEEVASEIVLGKLLQSQVAFLHSARRFISDAEASRVAERAMCQLQDTRYASSVEGLFLLVICLPTGFTRYDHYMDKWLALWSRIEHNATWDASWLTILCRARKSPAVYRSFDWGAITPFLFTKTRELLQLPGPVSSRVSNAGAYPASIPSHYLFLSSTSPFDARKTALHKIAKLLHAHCFYSFNGSPLEIVTASPLPITQASPDGLDTVSIPGLNVPAATVVGARDLASFYGSIRVYFHPSNTGSWSQDLGFLLGTQIGELARHVGREIAIRHGNIKSEYTNAVVRLPLHKSTAEFLIGMYSSLLLEMLYSKNFVLSHIAAHGLKNLAPLSPSLCHAILPSLVGTLDPSAVSKSHMALPAMTAISITFKSFLFPDPVVLHYLPSILRLALPGIDPNDTKKTLMTLNLYCKILCWIPIGESVHLSESKARGLLDLALDDNGDRVSSPNSALLFENARAATLEWAPAFMDRMLSLLDATEDANQHSPDDASAKSRRRHHSGSDRQGKSSNQRSNHIEESFRLFFAAISPESSLVGDICDKVLNHLKSSTPLHAAKEYTALVTGMIASHSEKLLGKVLSSLLDEGLRSGECSSEKLAFRLHLACGAVRRAKCSELLKVQQIGGVMRSAVDFLKPFLRPEFYAKHSDIRVQESARKLLRDVLRGLSASFPLEVSPVSSQRGVLGETTPNESSVVEWHIPTGDAIKETAALLKSCCSSALSAAVSIANGNEAMISKKAAEEELIAYLGVIHACCRGAADVLGDSVVAAAADTGEDGGDEDGTMSVINTGRQDIVAACSDDLIISELSCIRDAITRTLLTLHDILNDNDETKIIDISTNSASHGQLEAERGTLKMTPDIAALWLRAFEAVVMHRTWLKDPTMCKHSFSANKRQTTNSTARYTKRILERFGCGGAHGLACGGGIASHYSDSLYWERYDLPAVASSDRGIIQFSLFAKEYGHSSLRAIIHGDVKDGGNAFLFTSCFNRLVVLCGHSFESIRQDAIHFFNKISGYGWKLEKLIEPLLGNLNTVGIKFPVASGTLAILSTPLVLKRMVSRWYLMQQFLDVVPGTNAVFSAIDDMEKRLSLAEQFAGVFAKYIDKWSHLPLHSGASKYLPVSERESASVFLKKILDQAIRLSPAVPTDLEALNGEIPGHGSMDVDIPQESGSTPALNSPVVTSGIRHELYIAYIVMHLVGHRDVAPPSETWVWAIRQICTRRGHPIAALGMAVLARLAYTAAISADCGADAGRGSAPIPNLVVPPVVSELLGNDAVWKALLDGISHIGVKKPGESAQWSSGIDRMLRSADYIMQGFPRWITNNSFHNKTAGGAFRPVEASVFMCLFVICPSSLVADRVHSIIEASKNLVSSSEEETKGHNTLRANLFGGLLRVVQASYALAAIDAAELDQIDSLLNDFLSQQTQSISLGYCYDWADALTFGFSTVPVKIEGSGRIPSTILNNARAVLSSLNTNDSTASVELAPSVGDDGFARHAKNLLLAKGILNADLAVVSSYGYEAFSTLTSSAVSSYRHHYQPVHKISSVLFSLRHNNDGENVLNRSSAIAIELTKIFLDEASSLISSYRSIRVEIVEILAMLASAHFDQSTVELQDISSKLVVAADIGKISDADADELPTDVSASKEKAHNAIEIAILWLENALGGAAYRSADFIEQLLSVALVGSGCSDIDLAKRCHTTSLRAAALMSRGFVTAQGEISRWSTGENFIKNDLFSLMLKCCLLHCESQSWRVRATAVLASSIIMMASWMTMTLTERKDCKNAFNNAFYDKKPEIQLLGRAGMTAYLSTKLINELSDLSVAYTKNNDIFAAREKKKRRIAAGSTEPTVKDDKVDNVYITTIFMSAAMLAAFPYDLPPFAPSLLLSLLRHMNVPFFHDTVTRAVQDFKRTHQDRWEEEFKKHFSLEQLDDLQGAGAQTYFA